MFDDLIKKYIPGEMYVEGDMQNMILVNRNGFQLIIPKSGNNDDYGKFLINSIKGHDNYSYNDVSRHKYTVLKGRGEFIIDDIKKNVKEGATIDIEPKQVFSYKGSMLLIMEMTPNFKEENEHIIKYVNYD